MKNILHFQIPMNNNGMRKDDLLVSPELLSKFLKLIKDSMGEDYYIIASPFIPSMLSAENLLNFDVSQINLGEIMELLEEKRLDKINPHQINQTNSTLDGI